MDNVKGEITSKRHSGYYLSEATRLDEYELGKFNSIISPVGSGKSFYSENKLINEIDNMECVRDGYTILLAPLNTIVEQVACNNVYAKINQSQENRLNGDYLLGSDRERKDTNKLILMTPHKFFRIMLESPKEFRDVGLSNIRSIVFDEADFVFCELPTWEKTDDKKEDNEINMFTMASYFVKKYCDDILFIGITATNESGLRDIFGDKYNSITFKEELKQQQFSIEEEYSDLRLAFNRATEGLYEGDKVAIYIERISNMKLYRDYLESIGLRVAMITATNPDNYSPTKDEIAIKNELSMVKGVSETFHNKGYDVLMYNKSMERGVSIHDDSFKSVIVHSSKKDTQIQSVGRFRKDGLRKYVLANSENRVRVDRISVVVDGDGVVSDNIVVPQKYIDIPLTTKMKNELIDEIGYNKTWRGLKPDLLQLGYKIKDTQVRIDGKRPRVSIITK